MNVIITKDIYIKAAQYFDQCGIKLLLFPDGAEEEMLKTHRETGTKCFIIGTTRYSDYFYQSLSPGSMIVRFGVGYDSVPVGLCKERQIYVSYTPGTLDESVAEHTIGLILSYARRLIEADAAVKNATWGISPGIELKEKTLAVVGFGKIGRRTAEIAKYGFGMKINAFDIFMELDQKFSALVDFYSPDFKSVVNGADFVSLHMPVTQKTIGFIDRFKLALMKKEAVLVNTSRGKLINESDLYDALQEGVISGAALDVFQQEPYSPVAGKDLRTMSNVVLTPHIASNTKEANRRMAELSVKNCLNYYKGDFTEIELIPEMK
ncbi:MAG: NAD(P)-dependent oxidoreductase [Bacteroidota bacterium]